MAKKLPVSFKESEKELYEYCLEQDFSYYVKGLIKKDMQQNNVATPLNIPKNEEPKEIKKRNANFSF